MMGSICYSNPDPYVLDFLDLKDHYLERDFEDAILRELKSFLLELGAGFSFVARQKRIQIGETPGFRLFLQLLFDEEACARLARCVRILHPNNCCRVMTRQRGFCCGHFTIAVREQAGSNAAIPLQLATFEQPA
jgi:YhcG PDDEXK nuclease domain